MMRATDNLRSDHALIERGLAVLRQMATHIELGGGFPAEDCALALLFLRDFVIGVHLHKEARLLLPAAAMHGAETIAQVVGEVLRVHEEVTELTHSLVLFWEPVILLSAEERLGFAETVAAVVSRLRRLQVVEEGTLFPVCEREVPVDDQLDWLQQFASIEQARGGQPVWRERIAPLAARWLV